MIISVVQLHCDEALSSVHFCTYRGFSSTKVLLEALEAQNYTKYITLVSLEK